MNKSPQVYTHLVSLRLSDGQVARLDARKGKGASRADVIREALDGVIHDGHHVSHDDRDGVIHDGAAHEPPEGWALLGINTDVLRQLQERSARLTARNAELTAQLREYATGGQPGIDMTEGTRYVCHDGELVKDSRPLRRSVAHQPE